MQPLRGEQSWVALGNHAVPKPEIRNPKSKTNPKSKGQRLKTPQGSAGFGFLPFSAIWICFGFRVSDFGFPHRCWHRFFAYGAHETSQLRSFVTGRICLTRLKAPKACGFEADADWHAGCVVCVGKRSRAAAASHQLP